MRWNKFLGRFGSKSADENGQPLCVFLQHVYHPPKKFTQSIPSYSSQNIKVVTKSDVKMLEGGLEGERRTPRWGLTRRIDASLDGNKTTRVHVARHTR